MPLWIGGATTRIGDADVHNLNTDFHTQTNALGIFELLVGVGDTLEISKEGYQYKKVGIQAFTDLVVELQRPISLKEVVINEQVPSNTAKALASEYTKKNAIYYGGRPPLYLLNPFNGRPLTFFRELLSKDAKRVRKLNKNAAIEEQYAEVEQRFNKHVVKQVTALEGEALEEFRLTYWPTVEQVRTWSDYDLLNYIKLCNQEFQERKPDH